jgi:hypothetical protein
VPDTDEPSPIANESLVCCHDQLHISIGRGQFPIDPDETEFRLVTPELWAKLIKRYHLPPNTPCRGRGWGCIRSIMSVRSLVTIAMVLFSFTWCRKVVDRPIVLQVDRQDGGELVFRVDPAICLECTEARQNAILDQQYNYEEAEIVVTTKRRTPAGGGRARRSKAGEHPPPSLPHSPAHAAIAPAWLTFFSPACAVKTDKITVSADDTILVVKLKILEKLEIEPNEQVPATLHPCHD